MVKVFKALFLILCKHMTILRNAEDLLNVGLFPGDDLYLCVPHGDNKYRVFSGEDARIYQQILDE